MSELLRSLYRQFKVALRRHRLNRSRHRRRAAELCYATNLVNRHPAETDVVNPSPCLPTGRPRHPSAQRRAIKLRRFPHLAREVAYYLELFLDYERRAGWAMCGGERAVYEELQRCKREAWRNYQWSVFGQNEKALGGDGDNGRETRPLPVAGNTTGAEPHYPDHARFVMTSESVN